MIDSHNLEFIKFVLYLYWTLNVMFFIFKKLLIKITKLSLNLIYEKTIIMCIIDLLNFKFF